MPGRVARGELEALGALSGSALRGLFLASGMTVQRFAQWALAGRGERTLQRWLEEPATVPVRVDRWARSVEELVEESGQLRLVLNLPPLPRRGRPAGRAGQRPPPG